MNNHAYKILNKTQIIFMDKNLIINSNFIGSQQTHRKKSLHQINLQETIVWRIKERERKPSSYCLQTRRSMVDYSRTIREAPMRMMNPPDGVRLDLVVLELAAAGIVFSLLL